MILELLQAMSEIYGRPISTNAAKLFLSELSGFTEVELEKAIRRCLKELKTFPTVSDIISRIDDGRPGVEEAWAMVPKTEGHSVVWTEEIQKAFFAARELIEADPIAARMTFKEVYENELKRVRSEKIPVKWEVSLGHDKTHREMVIMQAATKKLIPLEYAAQLLPHYDPQVKDVVKRIGSGGLEKLTFDEFKK